MSNEQPDDPIARLRAEMDQSKETVKEFAGVLWTFHSECIAQGFPEEHAFALTVTFMQEQMASGS